MKLEIFFEETSCLLEYLLRKGVKNENINDRSKVSLEFKIFSVALCIFHSKHVYKTPIIDLNEFVEILYAKGCYLDLSDDDHEKELFNYKTYINNKIKSYVDEIESVLYLTDDFPYIIYNAMVISPLKRINEEFYNNIDFDYDDPGFTNELKRVVNLLLYFLINTDEYIYVYNNAKAYNKLLNKNGDKLPHTVEKIIKDLNITNELKLETLNRILIGKLTMAQFIYNKGQDISWIERQKESVPTCEKHTFNVFLELNLSAKNIQHVAVLWIVNKSTDLQIQSAPVYPGSIISILNYSRKFWPNWINTFSPVCAKIHGEEYFYKATPEDWNEIMSQNEYFIDNWSKFSLL